MNPLFASFVLPMADVDSCRIVNKKFGTDDHTTINWKHWGFRINAHTRLYLNGVERWRQMR